MEAGQEPYQGPKPGEAQPPPPVNRDPEIIGNVFSGFIGFFEQYGWFIVIGLVILLYLKSKFQSNIQQWQDQREAGSYKKMDGNKAQERLEAMERARLKMQEQLDAQAKEFAEKQQQKEEEKRQEKIADWEGHQQGKGYRNKTKGPSDGSSPAPSSASSSGQKPLSQQPKKRLRPDFNPLMGDTGGACRFRPTPRGGASGGG